MKFFLESRGRHCHKYIPHIIEEIRKTQKKIGSLVVFVLPILMHYVASLDRHNGIIFTPLDFMQPLIGALQQQHSEGTHYTF